MVNAINNANLTWNADVYNKYRGKNLNEIKDILGLRKGLKRKKENKIIEDEEEKNNNNNNKKTKKIKNLNNVKFQNHLSMIQTNIKKTEKTENKEKNELLSKIKTEDFWKEKIEIPKKSSLNYEIKQIPNIEREKDSYDITDRNEIIKYINSSLDSIDENKLPLNWDWRNVGGENFVSQTINQGNCGSCFTISTIYSLESRLRIKTLNEDKTKLSIQFPLSCNFYSEGCDGGYPILVGKFFHEFEIVPKDCFEYEEENIDCENVCDYTKYKKKYIVSEFGYLGGFYGADTELLMIKELRARGPIPGNILVPLEFNYYKNGIFSEKDLKKIMELLILLV
jgi:cathepsin C